MNDNVALCVLLLRQVWYLNINIIFLSRTIEVIEVRNCCRSLNLAAPPFKF
jgi:hypothetical protein